ncbi:MAG: type VI secretion system baseplate subunit TssK [Nannocystaceae bacterium]
MHPNNEQVAWMDGMLLLPQHLQYQAKLQQRMLARVLTFSLPYATGLLRLELDSQQLEDGIFAVRAVEGVLPDNRYVCQARQDGVVAAQSLQSVQPGQVVPVYLGVRRCIEGAKNISSGPELSLSSRFRLGRRSIADIGQVDAFAEIEILEDNLQVIVGSPDFNAFHALKIASVAVEGGSRYRIVAGEVPSVLRISASRELSELLVRLNRNLLDAATAAGENPDRLSPAQQAAIPMLASRAGRLQAMTDSDAHPFEVWAVLIEVLGGVWGCTGGDLRRLPKYKHQDLMNCFGGLEQAIAKATRPLMAQEVGSFKFIPRNEHSLRVEIGAACIARTAERARLVLSMNPGDDVSGCTLAGVCKLVGEHVLDSHLDSALAGVPLRVNDALTKAERIVLTIDCRHRLWHELATSGVGGLFVPPAYLTRIQDVVLEVMAGDF